MKTLNRYPILILPLLILGSTYALPAVGSVIYFQGQLTEPPCNYQSSIRKVSATCFGNGQEVTQVISVDNLLRGQKIINEKSTATLLAVNLEKKVAVVNIEYN